MRILVTNDDGINAPGLVALEAIAAQRFQGVLDGLPQADKPAG